MLQHEGQTSQREGRNRKKWFLGVGGFFTAILAISTSINALSEHATTISSAYQTVIKVIESVTSHKFSNEEKKTTSNHTNSKEDQTNLDKKNNIHNLIKSGLNEYADKYPLANNNNDMSYIKEFYIGEDSRFFIDTKNTIDDWYYNKQLLVDSIKVQKFTETKINNTNKYKVVADLEYSYDHKGEKWNEDVVGRIYQIEITDGSKIVINEITDSGKSYSSYQIIKSGLSNYANKYPLANNNNAPDYIKELLSPSYFEQSKQTITLWNSEQIIVNSIKVQQFTVNRISNTNRYKVVTNLLYSFFNKETGEKWKEDVVGRIYEIEITNNHKMIIVDMIEPGASK